MEPTVTGDDESIFAGADKVGHPFEIGGLPPAGQIFDMAGAGAEVLADPSDIRLSLAALDQRGLHHYHAGKPINRFSRDRTIGFRDVEHKKNKSAYKVNRWPRDLWGLARDARGGSDENIGTRKPCAAAAGLARSNANMSAIQLMEITQMRDNNQI